jgi:hypothetical protein
MIRVRLADGREFDAPVVPPETGEAAIKLPTFRAGGPGGPGRVAPDELAGVVVDTRGRPLQGVLADAISWAPGQSALTDGDGRTWIKVPEQDRYEIRLSKTGSTPSPGGPPVQGGRPRRWSGGRRGIRGPGPRRGPPRLSRPG